MRLSLAPILALIAATTATVAQAYDYAGRLALGIYQSKEQFTEPSAGSATNDQGKVLASAYLDLTKIGPFSNQITIDFRDRYEQFGAIDAAAPRLIPSNEPQLRQLAVKNPYMSGKLYWAIGRFPVVDAAVLGNDGAEFGYRIAPQFKLGIFGGLHPEHRNDKTLALSEEDQQLGAYLVFDDPGREWTRHMYAATAIVSRTPAVIAAKEVPADDAELDPVAELENRDADRQPEMFWYTNLIYQPSERRRVTYISHIDLAPTAAARNVWLAWQERLQPRVTGRVSLLHIDLTEYEKQRDIRDRLPGSTFTVAKFNSRFNLNNDYMAEGEVSQGSRGYDSKSRTEFLGKIVAGRLASGALSAFVGAGYRQNFTSKDMILRAGGTYYTKALELSLTQQYLSEARDDGQTLHPLITGVSAGAMLGRNLIASVGGEYAKDEEVTIMSALLTLGYRFTNAHLTPIRSTPPPLERL